MVDKNLNAIDQLSKINGYANELLDLLMRWNRGDDEALRILESQVRKVNRGTRKEPEWVDEYRFKDPRELALKAMAEVRSQLSLQLDIFKTFHDVQATADFQEDVLEAIGEVNPDVRSKIVQKLKERRTLRGSISLN